MSFISLKELLEVSAVEHSFDLITVQFYTGIIIEYMDRGSLEFMLDDNLEVGEAVMAAIVYQILWGLGYLHYDNRLVNEMQKFRYCLISRTI